MPFRKKCPECNSCMSPVWKDTERYMYCGFCKQYYAGQIDNLEKVESPFKEIPTNKVEDPVMEENEKE